MNCFRPTTGYCTRYVTNRAPELSRHKIKALKENLQTENLILEPNNIQ